MPVSYMQSMAYESNPISSQIGNGSNLGSVLYHISKTCISGREDPTSCHASQYQMRSQANPPMALHAGTRLLKPVPHLETTACNHAITIPSDDPICRYGNPDTESCDPTIVYQPTSKPGFTEKAETYASLDKSSRLR